MPAVWALPECCGPAMRLCVQTSTKTNEENPVWNEEFDLVVDEPVSWGPLPAFRAVCYLRLPATVQVVEQGGV